MTISVWRYAHLTLAIISSLFLLILSITGVILAYDAIDEKKQGYRVSNFDKLTLAECLPIIQNAYLEVIDVKVDHNDYVILEAMDDNGNTIQAYIDPLTGKKLGDLKPKSQFIQWTTALHRSLFLKETGRAIVAVVSFLLTVIAVSGFVLILKRQKSLRYFFAKIHKEYFASYFHVVAGRWLLLPILIIALTGCLIYALRLDFLKSAPTEITHNLVSNNINSQELKDFAFFKETKLADVERIEFPFIPNDVDEPFIVHLKNKSVTVNQVSGEVISESVYPYSAVIEKISINLHTGKKNILWAIILGIASLNILFFIYSGFTITFKRTRSKIKNRYKGDEAEIIILVGSENGTTLFFANQIQKQFLASGKKVFLCEMNNYTLFPKATHFIIFTSTYGVGEAPSNATSFCKEIEKTPQRQQIYYSVVGFGSTAYAEFCAYAKAVDEKLKEQDWTLQTVSLFTVNNRSAEDFLEWVQAWSLKTNITLETSPSVYQIKAPERTKFKVIAKTATTEDNQTFKILLQASSKATFNSGDLLAIYPTNDDQERLYSIGKSNDLVQLIVKLVPNGIGSGYLNRLQIGETLSAQILRNASFHFPKEARTIAMIANGTGITPFLGMIEENDKACTINLYVGLKNESSLSKEYKNFAKKQIANKKLTNLHIAFSREKNKQYVMDLIRRDSTYFAQLLRDGGIIMICGSLAMQKDVENALNSITKDYNNKDLQFYIENGQLRRDCY